VALSDEQRQFVTTLAETIATESDLNGQGMHDAIYAASLSANLKPAQAFTTLYQLILGQDKGPKAGFFLSTLDRPWLLERLQSAAASF
jgi:lysyl-tRNA synthetase class 1